MMYDLGIIGAGPAGYVAAERAGHKGLKVVVFDKRHLGGVCLNEGCIPTKTLLYTAKLYENALNGEKYGISCSKVAFDMGRIMERKDRVVKKLVGGVASALKSAKAEVVYSEAVIEEKKSDHIVICAGNQKYECRNLLIATGSEAAIPPVKGLDKSNALTNREILQLKEIPKSINIIGGGVIGIEFAGFYNSMGAKVSVFEMLDEILPGVDKELSVMLRRELTKKGVDFYLGAKVEEVKGTAVVITAKDGPSEIQADKLLVAVGRKMNVGGIGLEKTGVEFSPKGIKIDNHCRTNIPNIYAAGDITGFSLLAHTAYREAEVAVNHMTGEKDVMRYDAIPGVVYTNPEIAWAGLTEEEAVSRGISFKKASLPLAYAGRFVAENEGKNGLIKVIAGEKYGEILGVHIIGNPSSELIYGAAMAIEMQMRVKDMREIVFPHPTVSEIFKEIAFTL
ncbi:MAG: dihydrolipoyl dehydrogenase [Bacteroidales bacterium]|nr:dihydrolipoyl dehydrogenase [Bacteroidales bacterium]